MRINHLLLIAISDYAEWHPLRGPGRDADALKQVLFDRYGFGPETTVELRDADAGVEAILKAFPEKPMNPRRGARLILRGVDRNRFLIITSVTAHALWRLHRYAPNTSIRLGKIAINKFRSLRREDD